MEYRILNYMSSISSSAVLSWCEADSPRLCGAIVHVIIHVLPRHNQSFDLLRFVILIDAGCESVRTMYGIGYR